MESVHDVKPRLAEAASRLSSKEIPCIFCKKLWESRLTIINDKKDILGALEALYVKYEPIPGVMDYACYKCVYRINVIIDFRRLLERNLNKTRANYYYTLGNKDMCRKFLECNDVYISNTANSTSSECLNLLITDVRSEREPERTADYLFDCFNDPDTHYRQEETAMNSSSRLLEPMYETEFAESSIGATNRSGHKYKNYNNLNDTKYKYKCQYCTKTYKMLHHFKKHERKHRAKVLRRESMRSVSVNRSFQCETCLETFNTRAALKNHRLSHRNRIKCSHCTAEFYLRHDVELHEAQCFGEISAKDDNASVRTYYMRTRTNAQTVVSESGRNSVSDRGTVYRERMKDVDDWVDNVDANYDSDCTSHGRNDDDDKISSASWNSSFISVFSRPSTVVSAYSYADSDRSSVVSARIEQRVTYDKAKVNNKLLSTKSSVYGGGKRTRAALNREEQMQNLDNFLNSQGSKNKYSSPDWQRYRKRAKREKKAKAQEEGDSKPIYYCQFAKCYFFHESLVEMMRHDIDVHSQLPLYRCTECQLRFTRQNYLQCHKMDHPAQHYPCNLCSEIFEYKSDWKYHLELHAIRSHKCPLCPRSFLKESQLAKHILEKSHRKTKSVTQRYHLVDERENKENSEPPENNGEDIEENHVPYTVHFRPQSDTLQRKMKFEKVRWTLGPSLTCYTGINTLTLEIDGDDMEPIIRDEAEQISLDDVSPNQFTPDDRDDQVETPPADISENEPVIELPPQSPVDLETLNLFSVDGIHEAESNCGENESGLQDDREDSITLSMKCAEDGNETLQGSIPPASCPDPGLPSYTSVINSKMKNQRLRILPLLNVSLPSRLPC